MVTKMCSMCLYFKKLISLIKLKKKVIPSEKAWKNDYLGYKQLADRFSTIIKTINNSFSVISLKGYSGWGKTFFLKEWIKDLKQQNEIAVYYSAWDINALDQPLASFLNFLFEDLFASYKIRKSTIKQFTHVNQELFSLNTLGKVISKSPLGMFSVLLDAAKEADSKDIGSVLRELSRLKRRKEGIEDFKKQLIKIVNKIRNGQNIYIMVDDLDMCRPKFIVDFLESIKYILNIEGFVFIISVNRDKNNVQKAINTILGSNFELKHFSDLSLSLSKQSIEVFTRELLNDVKLTKKSKDLVIDSFIFYAKSLSLSLKVIECCIKKIKFSCGKEELPQPNLFSFLVILQSINNSLYEDLQKETLEKIESAYKPAMLNYPNGQKEWEKLKISLEAALKEKELKTIKQIKNMLF